MDFILTIAIIIAFSLALSKNLFMRRLDNISKPPKLSDEIEKEYRDMYAWKPYSIIYPSKPKVKRKHFKAILKSKTA